MSQLSSSHATYGNLRGRARRAHVSRRACSSPRATSRAHKRAPRTRQAASRTGGATSGGQGDARVASLVRVLLRRFDHDVRKELRNHVGRAHVGDQPRVLSLALLQELVVGEELAELEFVLVEDCVDRRRHRTPAMVRPERHRGGHRDRPSICRRELLPLLRPAMPENRLSKASGQHGGAPSGARVSIIIVVLRARRVLRAGDVLARAGGERTACTSGAAPPRRARARPSCAVVHREGVGQGGALRGDARALQAVHVLRAVGAARPAAHATAAHRGDRWRARPRRDSRLHRAVRGLFAPPYAPNRAPTRAPARARWRVYARMPSVGIGDCALALLDSPPQGSAAT